MCHAAIHGGNRWYVVHGGVGRDAAALNVSVPIGVGVNEEGIAAKDIAKRQKGPSQNF